MNSVDIADKLRSVSFERRTEMMLKMKLAAGGKWCLLAEKSGVPQSVISRASTGAVISSVRALKLASWYLGQVQNGNS